MRPRALVAGVAALGVLAASGVASATTMRALDVSALSNDADSVIVGRVLSVSDVVHVDAGRLAPRTITRVAVDELVAGEATPSVIRIVEHEGTLGRLRIVHDTALELRRGQRVMLFLAEEAGTYRSVGLAQGAYVVRTDRVTHETTVARANDPGVLIGNAKSLGIDLDSTPSLDSVRQAVTRARAGR